MHSEIRWRDKEGASARVKDITSKAASFTRSKLWREKRGSESEVNRHNSMSTRRIKTSAVVIFRRPDLAHSHAAAHSTTALNESGSNRFVGLRIQVAPCVVRFAYALMALSIDNN